MKTFAQALDLKPDPALIRQYIDHHKKVWPEVTAALRKIGITRMQIFLLGTRLFMIYEAPDDFDPARDYQSYTADPRCREWDQLMRQFQVPAPGAKPTAWWAPMQCVFDLNTTPD